MLNSVTVPYCSNNSRL